MVHLSGHTNSTLFTDCCGIAICDDEKKCPDRFDHAMAQFYGREKLSIFLFHRK
jgi:hypothetical protein